jgi:hypothetical protein
MTQTVKNEINEKKATKSAASTEPTETFAERLDRYLSAKNLEVAGWALVGVSAVAFAASFFVVHAGAVGLIAAMLGVTALCAAAARHVIAGDSMITKIPGMVQLSRGERYNN